jgi:uncharacterized protein (AIM24 family)
MPSHQLDYEILGASAQSVEIILDPGETVIAEAGVMNYMTDGIRFETRMGDGAASGVLGKLWVVVYDAFLQCRQKPSADSFCRTLSWHRGADPVG